MSIGVAIALAFVTSAPSDDGSNVAAQLIGSALVAISIGAIACLAGLWNAILRYRKIEDERDKEKSN